MNVAAKHLETIASRRQGLVFTTVMSGVIGCCIGISFESGQSDLYMSQIYAGLVEYPSGNLIESTAKLAWSLVNQIPALFLWMGVAEQTLSVAIGGLQGMLSFQALALTSFVICGDGIASTLVAMLIYLTGAHFFGVTYGSWIVHPAGHPPFGQALCTIIIALWGAGCRRLASLCIGLLFCVHVVIGAWVLGLTALGLVVTRHLAPRDIVRLIPFFLGGLSLTVASLLFQMIIVPNDGSAAPMASGMESVYLRAWVEHWDHHRRAVSLLSKPYMLALSIGLAALVVPTYWCFRWAKKLPDRVVLFLSMVGIGAMLGLCLAVVSVLHLALPDLLQIAMPGKFITLVVFSYPAVVLGIVCSAHATLGRWCLAVAAVLVIVSSSWFASPEMLLSEGQPGMMGSFGRRIVFGGLMVFSLVALATRPTWAGASQARRSRAFSLMVILWCGVVLATCLTFYGKKYCIVISLVAAIIVSLGTAVSRWYSAVEDRRSASGGFSVANLAVCAALMALCCYTLGTAFGSGFSLLLIAGLLLSEPLSVWPIGSAQRIRRVAIGLACVGGVVFLTAQASARWQRTERAISDKWRSRIEVVLPADDKAPLLLSPGIDGIPLATRRPVVLQPGSFDDFPYKLPTAPRLNRLLREVYGVDILDPPPVIRNDRMGRLPPGFAKELWEVRTTGEWRRLADRFQFSRVLALSDWQLQLPVVRENSEYRLFRIPDGP